MLLHGSSVSATGKSIAFGKAVFSGADPGFGQGGAPSCEAESCQHSEASNLWPGSRACLRTREAFGVLKYAFSHILETLFFL